MRKPSPKYILRVPLDPDFHQQVHQRLQDPMRVDNKKRRGSLPVLITALLAEWLASNRTLEELTGE